MTIFAAIYLFWALASDASELASELQMYTSIDFTMIFGGTEAKNEKNFFHKQFGSKSVLVTHKTVLPPHKSELLPRKSQFVSQKSELRRKFPDLASTRTALDPGGVSFNFREVSFKSYEVGFS